MKRVIRIVVFVGLAALIVMQFIPIDRENPPVTREVQWDSPETRVLAQRACFDCHSNETVWPWYTYVAPISFRIASHVEVGRDRLNFSAWDQPNEDFAEIEESIVEGEMPLWDYLLAHSEADLTDEEVTALLDGLQRTLENDPPIERQQRGRP